MDKVKRLESRLIRLIYVGFGLIVGVIGLLNLMVFNIVGGLMFKLLIVGMLFAVTTIYRRSKILARLIVIEETIDK